MLKRGMLNPSIHLPLSRVRRTNSLVIADRGFPFWPHIKTIDAPLVDALPRVLDVVRAIREHFHIGNVAMAERLRTTNRSETGLDFERTLEGIRLTFEPNVKLNLRRIVRASLSPGRKSICSSGRPENEDATD